MNRECKKLPLITGGALSLTNKCNLACRYCFITQKPLEMTYQIALDACEFFAENAKKSNTKPYIAFFGGEPLLKYDEIIVPLTKYIREKYGDNYSLVITTNGTLLDEEKIKFLKANNIDIMVSFDGDEKTQNLNRPFHNGEGSFAILKERIPMFLKYYPDMIFRSTLDPDNANEFFNNHKFAVENGYKHIMTAINPFSKWNEEQKQELKKQVRLVSDYYLDLLENDKEISISPLIEWFDKVRKNELAKINNSFREYKGEACGFGKCGVGAACFASIGATGNIYSCQELNDNFEIGDNFIIGNIYTGIDDNKRWKIINSFHIKSFHSNVFNCEECNLYNTCDGGCIINNYFVNKDLNVLAENSCFYKQLWYEEALRILKIGKKYKKINNIFIKNKII